MRWLLLISILLVVTLAYAAPKVVVVGLFQGRALVEIDGKHQMMREGQEKQGVLLKSATSKHAVIEVDGVESTYGLGGRIGGTFAEPEFKEETIWANQRGEFHTVGQINGYPVPMLLDTGATLVAINGNLADRLGVSYKKNPSGMVSTASGVVRAYQVNLNHVSVGGIKLYGVNAAVLEGTFPQTVLLGMSFLNRLHMEKNGQAMILKAR